MEKVTESMRGDIPNYGYLVSLVKEIREALEELAPAAWKEEISDNINLEILTQVRIFQLVLWIMVNRNTYLRQIYIVLLERYLNQVPRTDNTLDKFCSTLWISCKNCLLLRRNSRWRRVMINCWENWSKALNLIIEIQIHLFFVLSRVCASLWRN